MKKQYHHGNLKDSLIKLAIEKLEKNGAGSLSLRELAKQLGVSQTAPYKHFKDKKTLLIAIANEGFDRLEKFMKRNDWCEEKQDPVRLGRHYVTFSLENPALFQLMFSPELSNIIETGHLNNIHQSSHQTLLNSFLEGYQHNPESVERMVDAAASWGLAHGLACLLSDNKLSPQSCGFDKTQNFIDYVMAVHFKT